MGEWRGSVCGSRIDSSIHIRCRIRYYIIQNLRMSAAASNVCSTMLVGHSRLLTVCMRGVDPLFRTKTNIHRSCPRRSSCRWVS